jgi:predicted phosphodiesterase
MLSARYAEEEMITLAGVRILLTHGHRQGVKYGLGAAVAYAEGRQADVLVFGHTHQALEVHAGPDLPPGPHTFPAARPLLVCNPGSVGSYPYTFGTLTIREGQMLFGIGQIQ